MFVQIWRGIGYNCIVYLATILGIDRGIYEAASIDGASKIQQVFQITLPLLKPTIIMITLLAVGRIFNSDFGLFYQVPQQSGALSLRNADDRHLCVPGPAWRNDYAHGSAAGVYPVHCRLHPRYVC